MRPFRFRAQAALDLRITQEEAALRVLARAQNDAERARARVDEASHAVVAADRQFQFSQHEGISGSLLGWHRSWIAKQRQEVEARKREAATSAAAVDRAAASVRDTHRRRRTLERLRDRSRRAHDLEAGRQDTREMNMLAGLRYLAKDDRDGGSTSDDRSHDSHQRPGGRDDDHRSGKA
jgi:flagellar export protein FliJ